MNYDVSIVSKSSAGWHVDQLMKAAKKYELKANVINFASANLLHESISEIGEIVLWRASSLDIQSERAALGVLLRGRHLINRSIFTAPYSPYKYYQQIAASKPTKIRAIPTFRYKSVEKIETAIDEGILVFPFIAKPNLGSQGKGVLLVTDKAQLPDLASKMESYIFQNYIENDGDWRVIVLGGKSLGAMKRLAKSGSHLNNISQGGTAQLETDPKTLLKITKLALAVASFFGYTYCGVDIIKDAKTGKYYFLEVNSAPQWDGDQGFQAITGVDVADELMKHCAQVLARKNNSTAQLVQKNYDDNMSRLLDKEFHYCSRMYLWTRGERYRQRLDSLKSEYIGRDETEFADTIARITDGSVKPSVSPDEERQHYFAKYPQLRQYNSLLFKVLFAESIYGDNLRPIVNKLVAVEDFMKLYGQISNDERAIQILSTHAINFFYNLENYLAGLDGDSPTLSLDPAELLKLARNYDTSMKSLSIERIRKYQVYLLTHAVIGASGFYSRSVDSPVYTEMMEFGEQIIEGSYPYVSLDNKLEYLVCAKLSGYKSRLETMILEEAAASLSYSGNFIVDTLNQTKSAMSTGNNISTSEHRNVLYLMATQPFASSKRTKELKRRVTAGNEGEAGNGLAEIGRKALINIPQAGLRDVAVRVDTGAYYSTIDAHDITLIPSSSGSPAKLSFVIRGSLEPIVTSKFRQTRVRSTTGEQENRYIVMLKIELHGATFETAVSLADRSRMRFSGILGRRLLKRGFIVNPARAFSRYDEKKGEAV